VVGSGRNERSDLANSEPACCLHSGPTAATVLLKFPAVKLQRLARVLPAPWLQYLRKSYIHPAILDAYIDGVVTLKARGGRSGRDNTALSPVESAVVAMLQRRSRPNVRRHPAHALSA
jgi:hypothetical protein